MAHIIKDKVKGKLGKLPGSGKSSGRSSPTDGKCSPMGRQIPLEPVQQQRNGGKMAERDAEPALQVHNLARSSKMSKQLEWDEGLAKDADKYAHELAQKGRLEHSGVEKHGENIFMSDGGDATFEDAVQIWLNGEKDYHGEEVGKGNYEDWRHFSQCIWHSSEKVGMGKARGEDGRTYVVARYFPPGNVPGGKPYYI